MRVVYLAHPVSGDVTRNLARAKRWLKWAIEDQHVVAIAPWIVECEIWDDADVLQREAGLARDLLVLERCDELWLCGGFLSRGMMRELEHAKATYIPVVDLLALGVEPPNA